MREERNELQDQSTKGKLLFLPPTLFPWCLNCKLNSFGSCIVCFIFLTTKTKLKKSKLTLEFNRKGENKADGTKLFFWSAISPYPHPYPELETN